MKAKTPEGLTLDEVREGIRFLRAERINMAPAKSAPRTKAAAPNADDLLAELGL